MDSQTTSTKQPATPFTNRGNEKWLSEERMPYPDGYFRSAATRGPFVSANGARCIQVGFSARFAAV